MRSQAKHTKQQTFSGPEKPIGSTGVALAFTLICLGLAAVWPGALFHVLGGDDPSLYLIKISAILIAALFIPVLLLIKIPALTGRIPGRLILFGVFISFLSALLAGNVSPQIRTFQEQAFVPTITPYLAKLKSMLREGDASQVSLTLPKARKKVAAKKPGDQKIPSFREIVEGLPLMDQHSYNTDLSNGDVHLAGYRFEQAIAEYDKAVGGFDNNVQAKTSRSEAIHRKLAFDESKVTTKRYLHQLAIGDAFLEKKQYDLAIAAYEKAREISPTGIKAITNSADAVRLKNQYGMELDKSNQAIEIHPDGPKGYLSRGQAHMGHGKYDLAITDFNRVIQLNPDAAQAFESRAHAHFKIGQYDLAIADFSKAIELESAPLRK